MNFSQYISKRIPEIKISHPHLTTHKQRMGLIFSEWQFKLKNDLKDKLMNPNDFVSTSIKNELSIKDAIHNWSKEEEDKLIDNVILGLSHAEIASIHNRSIANIQFMLYMIAIRLLKENKTTLSNITEIFDIDHNILANIINSTSKY